MPRRRADRSTVRSTTATVRLAPHQLAAIDTAAARLSQTSGETVTRNDLMLRAALGVVAELGISVEDPLGTLSLPFETATPGPTPAPIPTPAALLPAVAPGPAAAGVTRPKPPRGSPNMDGVDVIARRRA